MSLSSFIVSNTYRNEIAWWTDSGATEQDFTSNHVLFQQEDKETYIETLLKGALQG